MSEVTVRITCLGCEPDALTTSEIVEIRPCVNHQDVRDGLDDAGVSAQAYLSGSADAGGDDNRRWCELLHRR